MSSTTFSVSSEESSSRPSYWMCTTTITTMCCIIINIISSKTKYLFDNKWCQQSCRALWLVFANVFGVRGVFSSQRLRPPALVTEVPLGDAPALHAVDRKLAEALDDATLPVPTEEHLDGVEHADLEQQKGNFSRRLGRLKRH